MENPGRYHFWTQADVIRLTAVAPANLQNWVNRGIVRPYSASPGRAGKRLYSIDDLILVHGMHRLVQAGFVPSVAAPLVVLINRQLEKARLKYSPHPLIVIVRPLAPLTQHRLEILQADSLSSVAIRDSPFIVFNWGDVVNHVCAQVEDETDARTASESKKAPTIINRGKRPKRRDTEGIRKAISRKQAK